jgi:hypothetical protein
LFSGVRLPRASYMGTRQEGPPRCTPDTNTRRRGGDASPGDRTRRRDDPPRWAVRLSAAASQEAPRSGQPCRTHKGLSRARRAGARTPHRRGSVGSATQRLSNLPFSFLPASLFEETPAGGRSPPPSSSLCSACLRACQNLRRSKPSNGMAGRSLAGMALLLRASSMPARCGFMTSSAFRRRSSPTRRWCTLLSAPRPA